MPTELGTDFVMYLRGHVATDDGSSIPHDVMVERVCNARVRQQVYASFGGDFSMDLATMTETYVDATGDGTALRNQSNSSPEGGIPRRALSNCELRATIAGFRSEIVSLVDLDPTNSSIDVGSIVVHRTVKVKGMTTTAAYYLAPKEARKAYDKGLEAEKKGRWAEAQQDFSKTVEIYPKFTSAWFRLGVASQKLRQTESARTAYTRATEIDSKFLPPYLSLASMAFDAQDWIQVLNLTNHVLDLDPLKYAKVSGYILDLDPLDFAQAYFYNSAANFMLGKTEDAERSGLKAERLDVRPRFPQLHLLLAEIFAKKNDYTSAIIETNIYLDLLPHAKDADQVREQLAKLEKLNTSGAAGEKADPN